MAEAVGLTFLAQHTCAQGLVQRVDQRLCGRPAYGRGELEAEAVTKDCAGLEKAVGIRAEALEALADDLADALRDAPVGASHRGIGEVKALGQEVANDLFYEEGGTGGLWVAPLDHWPGDLRSA